MTSASPPDAGFERRCLLGAAFLFLLSAWFSIGFHHNDEHFQVLEFANLKLGLTPEGDLPWEYRARIRSWFQPAAALVVLRAFRALGVTDPFHHAFVLRLLSAVLYGGALLRLIRVSRHWYRSPEARLVAIVLSTCLWFVPYLAVRFSGEGWSGSLFVLGFASLMLAVARQPITVGEFALAGFALGLAFAARFQAGIIIASGLGWFLWAGRPRGSVVAAVAGGLGVALVGSLLLDRWGYGAWGLTPWRYLDIQLLEGTASRRFGESPWWWYLPKVLIAAGPPISLALVVGVLVAWRRWPASPLTWVSLPFFLIHCLLAHKELRFLFPLALLLPFLVALAVEGTPTAIRWLPDTRGRRRLWVALALLNGVGFVVRTLVPARQEIGMQKAVYQAGASRLLLINGKDPFVLGGLNSRFYRDPALRTADLTDPNGGLLLQELRDTALVAIPPGTAVDTSLVSCAILYRTFPGWVEREPYWSRLQWAEPVPWKLARCVARTSLSVGEIAVTW